MKPPTSNKTISLSFGPSNEALSNERLKWLWETNEPLGDHTSALTADEVAEALKAVAAERVHAEQAEQLRNAALTKLERYRRALTRERDLNAKLAAELAEMQIRLQAAEAALDNREQQLREDIAAALYQRASDLVIEAGRDDDDTMAAIISAEAQGFSNAALFIRDRTEQIPGDE